MLENKKVEMKGDVERCQEMTIDNERPMYNNL